MPRIIVPRTTFSKEESTSAARAIINLGQQILLCRGSAENFTHMPGGHIDLGETPEVALIRELQEEIGISPVSYHLVAEMDHEFIRGYDSVLEKQHSYIYNVKLAPFICELGQFSKEKKLSYEWHWLHQLQEASLQPPEIIPIILKYAVY